jgi:hypothetical protein
MYKIDIAGGSVEVESEEVAAKVQAALDALAAKVTEQEAAHTATVVELETKLAEALDPARIDERAQARADLFARAKRIAGQDHEPSGSDDEIRRAALVAAGVDLEGRSDAYVEARFDAQADVAPVTTSNDALAVARKAARGHDDAAPAIDLALCSLDRR